MERDEYISNGKAKSLEYHSDRLAEKQTQKRFYSGATLSVLALAAMDSMPVLFFPNKMDVAVFAVEGAFMALFGAGWALSADMVCEHQNEVKRLSGDGL